MFAIAILDIKKDMFLIARDRFGIKPIYTQIKMSFIFHLLQIHFSNGKFKKRVRFR